MAGIPLQGRLCMESRRSHLMCTDDPHQLGPRATLACTYGNSNVVSLERGTTFWKCLVGDEAIHTRGSHDAHDRGLGDDDGDMHSVAGTSREANDFCPMTLGGGSSAGQGKPRLFIDAQIVFNHCQDPSTCSKSAERASSTTTRGHSIGQDLLIAGISPTFLAECLAQRWFRRARSMTDSSSIDKSVQA